MEKTFRNIIQTVVDCLLFYRTDAGEERDALVAREQEAVFATEEEEEEVEAEKKKEKKTLFFLSLNASAAAQRAESAFECLLFLPLPEVSRAFIYSSIEKI